MEKSTSAKLKMATITARGPTSGPMDQSMSGNSKKINFMVREPTRMPMDQDMSVNSRSDYKMGKVPTRGLMERSMSGNVLNTLENMHWLNLPKRKMGMMRQENAISLSKDREIVSVTTRKFLNETHRIRKAK